MRELTFDVTSQWTDCSTQEQYLLFPICDGSILNLRTVGSQIRQVGAGTRDVMVLPAQHHVDAVSHMHSSERMTLAVLASAHRRGRLSSGKGGQEASVFVVRRAP